MIFHGATQVSSICLRVEKVGWLVMTKNQISDMLWKPILDLLHLCPLCCTISKCPLPTTNYDPRGLNRTFLLCYLYFCFCLEFSPLVMNRHLTPNLYHLDAIWVYSLIKNLTFSTNQGKIWQFYKNLIFGIIFA